MPDGPTQHKPVADIGPDLLCVPSDQTSQVKALLPVRSLHQPLRPPLSLAQHLRRAQEPRTLRRLPLTAEQLLARSIAHLDVCGRGGIHGAEQHFS